MDALEVIGGDRESLLIFGIPGNRSEEADFGLRIIGGLQLLEAGDEKGLDVEFSPKSREDDIVGGFNCSGVFI